MKYLTARHDSFRYTTPADAEGKCIEVDIDYEKGGMSYFTGTVAPRGIYMYVRPIAIKDGMRSFMLFDGFKRLLAPQKRLNRKKIQEVAERADVLAYDIATAYARGGEQEAKGVMAEMFGVVFPEMQLVA